MPLVPGASPVSLLFWNLAAAGALGSLFVALWMGIGRTRRGTPALDAALAFAVLVCVEAIVLNLLSVFHVLARAPVLITHIVLIAVAVAIIRRGRPLTSKHLAHVPVWYWAMLPLVAVVAASAFRYAPNNGDAMTYHLARVAHWIQNASVAPYPSLNLRQTIMMPGAEYIITALLMIAGSDHLAMLPEFAAWLIIGAAAPSLARLWGTPARWSWLAAPTVMATPLMVLQASSTKNDLVAALAALAVVAAILPLLHRRTSRPSTFIWLGVACAAAGLVKATAVIAALPFALVAAVTVIRAGVPRARIPALLFGLLIPMCLVLPEAACRQTFTRTSSPDFVYGASEDWNDRVLNPFRGFAHHIAIPFALEKRTSVGPREPWKNRPTRPHEDFAGNPLQLAVIAVLLGLTLFRWKRLPARSHIAAVCWLAGWVMLHVLLKDNHNLSRLQISWFVLLPVLAGAASGMPRGPRRARLGWGVATSFILILNGAWVASHNELRPPLVRSVGPKEAHYYRNGSVVMVEQAEALRIAKQSGCARIGLFMGESGFDYPITRAAMASGIATRHLLNDDGWACTIYFERLSWGRWDSSRPSVALDVNEWSVAATGHGGPFVFVRRGARDPGHR